MVPRGPDKALREALCLLPAAGLRGEGPSGSWSGDGLDRGSAARTDQLFWKLPYLPSVQSTLNFTPKSAAHTHRQTVMGPLRDSEWLPRKKAHSLRKVEWTLSCPEDWTRFLRKIWL